MKATVPEIAWHNKNPVFTIDIQPEVNKDFYRAATGGGDSHVVIWHLSIKEIENETKVSVEFAADLDRHIKAVNVVRFSGDAKLLASGDDDAVIIIWALKEDQNNTNSSFTNEEGNKENWASVKVLRGHKDDIYDICWSPSSNELISGSVDNTSIIWNVTKGQSTGTLGEHNGFVQGVAWDPKGKYLATLCSDRALRIFDADTRKMISKITKARFNKTTGHEEPENEENLIRLFHDDTVKTFFRRLCFSPDGNLVFTPCGIFRDGDNDNKPPKDVTYVFLKSKPERPVLHLPSRDEYTVAVRCCPVLFELNPTETDLLFTLPYRMVFAIASRRSIIFYDTQQLPPFGIVSDIHYATLTDISWSPDGRLLLASSSDGYCTIVTFAEGELGVPYRVSSSPSRCNILEETMKELEIQPLEQSTVQKPNDSVNNKNVSNIKIVVENSKTEMEVEEEITVVKEVLAERKVIKPTKVEVQKEISEQKTKKVEDNVVTQKEEAVEKEINEVKEEKMEEEVITQRETTVEKEINEQNEEKAEKEVVTQKEAAVEKEVKEEKMEEEVVTQKETMVEKEINEQNEEKPEKEVVTQKDKVIENEVSEQDQKNLEKEVNIQKEAVVEKEVSEQKEGKPEEEVVTHKEAVTEKEISEQKEGKPEEVVTHKEAVTEKEISEQKEELEKNVVIQKEEIVEKEISEEKEEKMEDEVITQEETMVEKEKNLNDSLAMDVDPEDNQEENKSCLDEDDKSEKS